MKKILTFSILMCLVCTLSMMCFGVSPFADVKESDWFYKGVVGAKQSGLMNGVSDTHFAPESTLSVDQAVTVVARLHSLYNDKSIPSEFQGYKYYMDYAVKHGIVSEDYFDNTTRAVKRSELSYLVYNSLDEKELSAINDIKFVPDAEYGSEYYEGLLCLYNAGILGGFDEYGAFRPDNNLTRAELSVVLDRILFPENRLKQTISDGSNREAFFLIDDFLMSNAARGIPEVSSGWLYDNTGSSDINSTSAFQNVLDDKKTDDNLSMSREIYPQFTGKVTLEVIYELMSGKDGLSFCFEDKKGKKALEIVTKDGNFVFLGADGESNTGVKSEKGKTTLKAELDLDNKTAVVYINGVLAGEHKTFSDFDGIYRLCVATGVKDVIKAKIDAVHLYKNYLVNDVFRVEKVGAKPLGYGTSGNVAVEEIASNQEKTSDIQSVKMTADKDAKASASKSFEKTSGKVRLEGFILLPDVTDGALFEVKNGTKTVLAVESKDGYWVCGDKQLRKFSKNIWQNIQINIDTDKNTAEIKINGKVCGENISVDAQSVDGVKISFAPNTQAVMWFDDIVVQCIYEYADYVPVPKVLESDYILSMMVCSLWRNGSHYGWQYIAPFEEITPVTGYYDEGSAEAMDWEIKFLTEHGFSDYHLCWYVPNVSAEAPIKKPRMVDALHGGYFNAKYSDMINFSIMWENANYVDTNIDNFKEYVWKYWCEWYFTDERYLKIDGKPFLSIYHPQDFYKMCSSNATTAKELINWMREDIKNYGFDDIYIVFSSTGRLRNENEIFRDIGIDTVHTYAWGSSASIVDVQKTMINEGYQYGKNYGVSPIAVASAGLNSFAWNMTRVDYMEPSEFERLLTWIRDDYLKNYESDSYLSKMIMFDNWNEFGEGHYLYPTSRAGFGYLEATAKVFGKGEKTSEGAKTVPTMAQKRRMGTLYPSVYTHLKREGNIKQKEILPEKAVRTFDFTQKSVCDAFTTSNMKNHGYSDSEKAFVLEAITPDPIMWYGKQTERRNIVNADEVDVIHIRMKSSTPSQGQIFFVTDLDSVYDEAKSFKFQITTAGEYVDYYIDTKSNRKWTGQIFSIRFDPHAVSGATAAITVFEFMQYEQTDRAFEIKVDGVNVSMHRDEVREFTDDEMYLCFKHESGIFQLLAASYRWNRHTKILEIDTKYGTKFVFTPGSDICLVDGKEVKLDKKVEMYDATVVLPAIFLLRTAKYDYVYAPDLSKLEVTVNSVGIDRVPEGSVTTTEKDGVYTVYFDVQPDSVYTLDFDAKFTDGSVDTPKISFFNGSENISVECETKTSKDGFAHLSVQFRTSANVKGDNTYVTIAKDGKKLHIKNLAIHRKDAPFYIKNGDAEGDDTLAFYNSNKATNTVEIAVDSQNSENKVWLAKNVNTTSQSWSYIRHKANFQKGATYEVEFDIRIISLSDGRPIKGTNVVINPRYYDENKQGQKNSNDHNVMAVKNLPSSEQWTHIKKTFTIGDGFVNSPDFTQEFSIYVEPVDGLGVTFEIDNIVIK